MFSLEPLDPSEQQTTQPVPQLQQCDALYRLAVSEPLPADSRQAANMQPVRPWSSHSMDRPTSAVGGSIQRPTSAAAKNQPDASGKPASADIMQQEPAGAEAVHDSTTVARIPSANSRPQSARPTRQQQKHQPSHATQPPQQQQEQEQQLQMTAQQQQERRITADVLKVLQTPRYHISADSGVKTALFPQQDLLQPPMQRIPKVMLDLIAAANSQAAADTPLLPSDGATIAAAAAGTPAGKRQASIVNIGSSSSCGSTNHQHSNVSACAHSSSNSSISDSTLPAGCLAVLGTIHEEDSAEQQHQGTVEQEQHAPAPVNLASDVSFDSSSYANSGHNSPASVFHNTRYPHSRPASSTAASCTHARQQQQGALEVSAAARDFYGSLASSASKPKARPWSAAVTQAARKLYGAQTMQLMGPGTQQQHQQRRCESAHPYYRIDTRLMARKGGKFSPFITLAASRGAGFRVQQPRPYSSQTLAASYNSNISRRVSAASAGALQAAAADSLNSSLSASRCSSRQQQQRQLQHSDSGSLAPSGYIKEVDSTGSEADAIEQQGSVSLYGGEVQLTAAAAGDEQERQQPQQHCGSRPWSAAAAVVSTSGEVASGAHMHYRLAASSPMAAATLVAAKLRKKQQECMSAAKAATKLSAPLGPGHSDNRHRKAGAAAANVAASRPNKLSCSNGEHDACTIYISSRKGSR